jgi:hypothetical protein
MLQVHYSTKLRPRLETSKKINAGGLSELRGSCIGGIPQEKMEVVIRRRHEAHRFIEND